MTVEAVRKYCLSLAHTTETVQWGNDLVFKIGGKMYAVAGLEPDEVWLAFKCPPEEFVELTEQQGIRPAPYLARAKWIALETPDALPPAEIRRLLRQSYDLVLAALPKREQAKLRG
ncbi:MAG: MmcQ/YjbR family DNA-binding protein [Bryobacteraceae bacterium]|nr:MmcQ/YjbR family DNA-binding protein [Bryobacteraceae bacterium]